MGVYANPRQARIKPAASLSGRARQAFRQSAM